MITIDKVYALMILDFLLNSNDEFDSTESDELLEDLMPPVVDQEQLDSSNQVCTDLANWSYIYMLIMQDARQRDHYTKLFSLCPLPSGEPVETRTPTALPQEQHGIKVMIKVVDIRWVWLYVRGCGYSLHALYRLDSTFEPIFAELALYDARERRKVSFYCTYICSTTPKGNLSKLQCT